MHTSAQCESSSLHVTDDLLSLIGNTPLLKLTRFCFRQKSVRLYAKLECMNISGSVKDRTALGLIEAAEINGYLKPGGTVVESTSGNLGISLATVCVRNGYKCICVLDPKTPVSNINRLMALGATIVMVDQADETGSYQKNRIARVKEICEQTAGSFNLDQYNNPASPLMHYNTTGKEIYRALGGAVNVLVGSVSTGGHLCGAARFLKELCCNLVVVGVEPEGSVLFGGTSYPYLQNGTGLSFIPNNLDRSVIDQGVKVNDKDAFTTAREFSRREGLLIGGSSGAVLYATCQYAHQLTEPANIVAILPDGGEKYLDTIYSNEWMEQHGFPINL